MLKLGLATFSPDWNIKRYRVLYLGTLLMDRIALYILIIHYACIYLFMGRFKSKHRLEFIKSIRKHYFDRKLRAKSGLISLIGTRKSFDLSRESCANIHRRLNKTNANDQQSDILSRCRGIKATSGPPSHGFRAPIQVHTAVNPLHIIECCLQFNNSYRNP